MSRKNEAWSIICELFYPHFLTYYFTNKAKRHIRQLYKEISKQKFLNFRNYLYKTLIIEPLTPDLLIEYHERYLHYIITGNTILQLYSGWRDTQEAPQ